MIYSFFSTIFYHVSEAIGTLIASLIAFLGLVGGKLLLAVAVLFVGRICIKKLSSIMQKGPFYESLDPTIRSFAKNFLEVVLYLILGISVISIVGVPMASVITVLASAGVAVGLSLQGALSNLAGGIMLLFFRPFSVGDYISASGADGTVNAITIMYTILISPDNKRITIPNGALMNANVVNFSSEDKRRVDMSFQLRYGSDVNKVNEILSGVMKSNPKILEDPEFFAGLTGSTEHAMIFTARGWVRTEDYWVVYSEMMEGISRALYEAGFREPSIKVMSE